MNFPDLITLYTGLKTLIVQWYLSLQNKEIISVSIELNVRIRISVPLLKVSILRLFYKMMNQLNGGIDEE